MTTTVGSRALTPILRAEPQHQPHGKHAQPRHLCAVHQYGAEVGRGGQRQPRHALEGGTDVEEAGVVAAAEEGRGGAGGGGEGVAEMSHRRAWIAHGGVKKHVVLWSHFFAQVIFQNLDILIKNNNCEPKLCNQDHRLLMLLVTYYATYITY